MSRLFSLLFAVMIAATPALADEWPVQAKMQMEAAGAQLRAATTTAGRVEALREIEAIAAAHLHPSGRRILDPEAGLAVVMKESSR